MDNRPLNNGALWLVLPVLLLVGFNALIPFMTVVNYSVQDIFGRAHIFVGMDWFEQILHSSEFQAALLRQVFFSCLVLLIEVPLGIMVALAMPTRGPGVSIALVLLALPLLIPWNVVGFIWQIFARPDIGMAGAFINYLGIPYNFTASTFAAFVTVLVMEVWHWTSLVVLLCYAGLRAIPAAFYQAARIDGASRWAVFRYVELPHMRGVLLIAILLRFMYSFKIYAGPFVLTGGGPGNATTFLSQRLATIAIQQFNLGLAGAYSLIYFLIVLLVSYVFYQVILNLGRREKRGES